MAVEEIKKHPKHSPMANAAFDGFLCQIDIQKSVRFSFGERTDFYEKAVSLRFRAS
jgi:hypothetical protein